MVAKSKSLTHDELLGKVERFIKLTHIRRYCTKICKGGCCSDCYTSNKKACHLVEGRRLACSMWMCGPLRHNIFTLKERDMWVRLGLATEGTLDKLLGPTLMLSMRLYHKPLSDKVRDTFKIKVGFWDRMYKVINIDKVKKKVDKLIEQKRIVHNTW